MSSVSLGHGAVARIFGRHSWTLLDQHPRCWRATGGVLTKVVPITGSIYSRQTTSGTTGYDYGSTDGETTCANIVDAIQAGQLVAPSDQPVMVYLDIEQGTNITPAYWAGWATSVYNYTYNGLAPFNPGIYKYYVRRNSSLYLPQSSAQTCLNPVCEYWPDTEYVCGGLAADEPEPCSHCVPSAIPDWSVFDALTKQDAKGG
jgi:hypothetical protein